MRNSGVPSGKWQAKLKNWHGKKYLDCQTNTVVRVNGKQKYFWIDKTISNGTFHALSYGIYIFDILII